MFATGAGKGDAVVIAIRHLHEEGSVSAGGAICVGVGDAHLLSDPTRGQGGSVYPMCCSHEQEEDIGVQSQPQDASQARIARA